MSKVSLTVNNKSYSGWESIQVSKSLLNIAGSFGFAATNLFGYSPDNWPIRLGDPCTVEVDGQVLITGYIEEMPISYDSEAHTIQVSGRDKTGDLVDCSYVETPVKWKKKSIETIVKTLCDPFDIEVVTDDTVATEAAVEIKEFTADQGQTVLELISRVCMHKAILSVCYGDGKLTLTRGGAKENATDNLELGVNIKSGLFDQSDMDRFSRYIVKSQDVATVDIPWASSVANRHGEAIDEVLTDKGRYRPLVIFAEEPENDKECQNLAEWEARVRRGQSRKIEYEVQGWTQRNGEVWPLNSLVRVKDKFLGIDGTRLISGVEFGIDGTSGTTARIIVVPKDTFDILEKPIKKEKALLPWS